MRLSNYKNKKTNKVIALILTIILTANFFIFPAIVNADEVGVLENEIAKQKAKIQELESKLGTYKDKIKAKENEALTLKNQLAILENQIKKIELDIQINTEKISQTILEITKTEKEITEKEEKIANHKEQLAELIRKINQNDNLTYLEIFLVNSNLSDFFDEIQILNSVQKDVQITVNNVQTEKQSLAAHQAKLELKKNGLEALKNQLETEQAKLEDSSKTKSIILTQTRNSEQAFKSLLAAARRDYNQANADIKSLEKKVREALAKQEEAGGSLDNNPTSLSWPTGGRQVVAYFHDPDYPYRSWIGEHPAIDIRTLKNKIPTNGISVRATASGYIARAKNGGARGYSYVMIVHSKGISTVYGHLSRIDVKEDTYVARGQQIGLSGGMPGTPGAGRFTTGPHLHFEVRLNGIPVNPLNYLP